MGRRGDGRRGRRGARALLAGGLVVGLLLSGCAAIPTSGAITQVSIDPADAAPLNIQPRPPGPGASPADVLDGFLAAISSTYPGRFDVAREYLTDAAARDWDPGAGASIYDSTGLPPLTTDRSAVVRAPLVGELDAAGHFTAVSEPAWQHDFGMVRVDGQWRISDPGKGLLLPLYLYRSYYRAVSVYYLSLDRHRVVAESVHLNEADADATGTIRALLLGPSAWLSPVVATAIPAGTTLAAPIVTVDKVTEVSLTEPIKGLSDDERGQLAAQVLWSLSHFLGMGTVRITVKGATYPVGQNLDGVMGFPLVTSYQPFTEPTTRDGFLLRATMLTRLDPASAGPSVPVTGRLGRAGGEALAGLAVSADATVVAGVTGDGTQLLETSLSSADAPAVLTTGEGLVRPQIDAAGRVWEFAHAADVPVLLRCDEKACLPVSVTALAGKQVLAFRISPDQTKIAVIVQDGARTELGLFRLHTTQLVVDGWRVLSVSTSRGAMAAYKDVAWVNDTDLMILAQGSGDSYFSTFVVPADGSGVTGCGPSNDIAPVALVALPQREAGLAAMLETGDGRAYRLEDQSRWTLVAASGVTGLAYAG